MHAVWRGVVCAASLVLAACSGGGGGGDGGVTDPPMVGGGGTGSGSSTNICGGGGLASGATTKSYTGVALNGEVVSITVDFAAKTYTYTVLNSNYALGGSAARTATIQINSVDGTCQAVLPPPSGSSSSANAFAFIYAKSNGLLIAAIRERFGSTEGVMPVIAFDSLQTSLPPMDGTYNAVQWRCATTLTGCAVTYGERQFISASATSGAQIGCQAPDQLTSCTLPFELAIVPDTTPGLPAGFWKAQVLEGSPLALRDAARFIFWKNGSEQIAVFIPDTSLEPSSPQVGLTVYATQAAVGATNGTVQTISTTGSSLAYTFNGTEFTRAAVSNNFGVNDPWTGFISAPPGSGSFVGVYSGAGLLAAVDSSNRMTIGLKVD